MGRSSTFHLHDRLAGGTLGARLLAWQDAGVSLDRMGEILRSEGVAVSRETVRRWLKELAATPQDVA